MSTSHTPSEPRVVDRPEQPYVAVKGIVTMDAFPAVADRLPQVLGWLAGRGLAPAGPPFFRYHLIDLQRRLEVEAGVPVAAPVGGAGLAEDLTEDLAEGEVLAGVLPAGRYLSATHLGHPDGLIDAAGRLLAWAAERGLALDVTATDQGQRWGCRLEVLKYHPLEQPDPATWETELLIRLAAG